MKAYSLNEVTCEVGGVTLSEQMGEISIEPLGQRFSFRIGVDGVVVVQEDKGQDSCNVKITCFQSSNINDRLSAIYQLARLSGAGTAGIVPIYIRDRQGTTLFAALECIVAGMAPTKFAKEVGDREWTILVANPEYFAGGN